MRAGQWARQWDMGTFKAYYIIKCSHIPLPSPLSCPHFYKTLASGADCRGPAAGPQGIRRTAAWPAQQNNLWRFDSSTRMAQRLPLERQLPHHAWRSPPRPGKPKPNVLIVRSPPMPRPKLIDPVYTLMISATHSPGHICCWE